MERISTHQFMVVTTGVIMGFTFMPVAQTAVMEGTGRDGWLSVLPGYALAIPLGLMVLCVAERFPGQNFIKISENLLGKWPAKGLGLMYSGISLYFGGLLLAANRDVFQRSILPQVPGMIFCAGIAFLVVLLAWLGIEVYARFSEIIVPVFIILLLLVIIASIPRIEWEEFFPLPLTANGPLPALRGAWRITGFAGEYIFFLFGLLPFLPQGQGARLRTGIWRAVILVGAGSAILTLIEIMVFGPSETERLNYGLLSLGKMIEISKMVYGVESIIMVILMGANILKVTAFYLGTVWGLQAVFNLKDQLGLYLAVGLIFAAIAYRVPGGSWLGIELGKVDSYLVRNLPLIWVPLAWFMALRQGKRRPQ